MKNMADLKRECPHLAAYNPFDLEHLADPYPLWRELQRHAPVFFIESAGIWAVTSYKLIEEVTRDTETFTSRYSLNFPEVPEDVRDLLPWGYPNDHPSLINTDPPEHTRIRRLAQKPLTAGEVKKLEPKIREIGNALIDGFIGDGQCDLVTAFATPFPVGVISDILGAPKDDRDDFKRWTDYGFLLSSPNLESEQLHECSVGLAALKDYLLSMLHERRMTPQDDLMTKLINAREADLPALDDKQIISIVAQLLIAGNGTTTDLIGNMTNILLRDESLWQTVKEDLSLCPEVVEEALRIASSIRGLFRTTTRDVELGGVQLPQGATLWVVFGATGHDESIFTSPEKFDLTRENKYKHMSFGLGRHFCLGASLARFEGKIALELLATRLPSMRLVANQQLQYLPSVVSHGPSHLHVEWDASNA